VEWLLIVPAAAILMAAALAVAAALVAGASDREGVTGQHERAAIWEAGYTDRDLRLLAGMAAAAHTELGAGAVEVVLAHAGGTGDGVVVTGSHVPPSRLGARVPRGDGLAGRGLAAGRTTLAAGRVQRGGPGEGRGGGALPDDAPAPLEGLTAACVPILSRGRIVGVVTATAAAPDRPLGPWHVARLEALAEEAGRRLGRHATLEGGDEHRHAG
jgi:GAF domain-containing protein